MVAASLALGEIVSWTPPTSVDFSTLKTALVGAGLTVDKYVTDMLPRYAFARASHKLEENRIIRKIDEDATEIRFQATREFLDQTAKEFQYSKEAVITLNKASGQVQCELPELQSKVQSLIDAEVQVRKAADITRLVQRIFEKQDGDLVAIREAGGAYFVPSRCLELVDRVQTFLNAIHGKLLRFQIGGSSEETKRSISESMQDHFTKLINEFQHSCENVSPDSSEIVMKRRVERIRELRFKLNTFRDLLSENAATISGAIAEAESMLHAKRTGAVVPEPQMQDSLKVPVAADNAATPEEEPVLAF